MKNKTPEIKNTKNCEHILNKYKLDIKRQTIWLILKRSDEYLSTNDSNTCQKRNCREKQLEDTLIDWVNAKIFKFNITENLIREKANKLSLNLGIERLTFSDS